MTDDHNSLFPQWALGGALARCNCLLLMRAGRILLCMGVQLLVLWMVYTLFMALVASFDEPPLPPFLDASNRPILPGPVQTACACECFLRSNSARFVRLCSTRYFGHWFAPIGHDLDRERPRKVVAATVLFR